MTERRSSSTKQQSHKHLSVPSLSHNRKTPTKSSNSSFSPRGENSSFNTSFSIIEKSPSRRSNSTLNQSKESSTLSFNNSYGFNETNPYKSLSSTLQQSVSKYPIEIDDSIRDYNSHHRSSFYKNKITKENFQKYMMELVINDNGNLSKERNQKKNELIAFLWQIISEKCDQVNTVNTNNSYPLSKLIIDIPTQSYNSPNKPMGTFVEVVKALDFIRVKTDDGSSTPLKAYAVDQGLSLIGNVVGSMFK